jgi:hypothetical protein
MKLALDHPEMIVRGVMNALLYMPLPSRSDPRSRRALKNARRTKSLCQSSYFQTLPMVIKNRWNSTGLCSARTRSANSFYPDAIEPDAHTSWNYFAELMSTDLSTISKR